MGQIFRPIPVELKIMNDLQKYPNSLFTLIDTHYGVWRFSFCQSNEKLLRHVSRRPKFRTNFWQPILSYTDDDFLSSLETGTCSNCHALTCVAESFDGVRRIFSGDLARNVAVLVEVDPGGDAGLVESGVVHLVGLVRLLDGVV